MTIQRIWYYIKIWPRNLISFKAGSALLSSFGTLWLCVEIVDYFSKGSGLPSAIQEYWYLFALTGVVFALVICRPVRSISSNLNGRDVTVEIAVGNIFSFPGALIVGTNTTFDTLISRELISEKSIQGQFTKKYYKDHVQLDSELCNGLTKDPYNELKEPRKGKSKQYQIGTVVKVNPNERSAYFVSIAHLNEHGVALGCFEDLKQSLGKLWVFIGQRGLKEKIVIPVLGSGFARLPQKREEIIREIIKSFIAACSEKVICDKLTIVLNERDVLQHEIKLKKLGDYLIHVCTYAEYADNTETRTGTALSQ